MRVAVHIYPTNLIRMSAPQSFFSAIRTDPKPLGSLRSSIMKCSKTSLFPPIVHRNITFRYRLSAAQIKHLINLAGHQTHPLFGTRLRLCTHVHYRGMTATFSAAQTFSPAR